MLLAGCSLSYVEGMISRLFVFYNRPPQNFEQSGFSLFVTFFNQRISPSTLVVNCINVFKILVFLFLFERIFLISCLSCSTKNLYNSLAVFSVAFQLPTADGRQDFLWKCVRHR